MWLVRFFFVKVVMLKNRPHAMSFCSSNVVIASSMPVRISVFFF